MTSTSTNLNASSREIWYHSTIPASDFWRLVPMLQRATFDWCSNAFWSHSISNLATITRLPKGFWASQGSAIEFHFGEGWACVAPLSSTRSGLADCCRMSYKFEMVIDVPWSYHCSFLFPYLMVYFRKAAWFRPLWRYNSERNSMTCHNQRLTWMCLWVTVGPQVAGGRSFHFSSRVHGRYCLYHGLWWCWSLLCLL